MSVVKSGELIIKSEPFAYKLSIIWRGKRCDTCFKSFTTRRISCANCGMAFYCSKECERADRKHHKHECMKLGAPWLRLGPTMPQRFAGMSNDSSVIDYVIILGRIIQTLRAGGDKKSEKIGNVTRTFADLVSHSAEIKADHIHVQNLKAVYIGLKHLLGGHVVPFDEFIEIAGKVKINSVTIIDVEGQDIGSGLFLGPSVIDHSCRPNAYFYFDGPNMLVRSSIDHEDFDISKVFIPYIKLIDLKAVRQESLLRQFYFVCKCAGCEDDSMDKKMQSIGCDGADCEEPVYIRSDKCAKCGTPVKPEKRNAALAISDKITASLMTIKGIPERGQRLDKAFDCLLKVMDRAENVLHPFNALFVKGAENAFYVGGVRNHWQRAVSHGLQVLQGYREYQNGLYPLLRRHLDKLGIAEYYLPDIGNSRIHTQEAVNMSTIMFGEGHPNTQKLREFLQSI